MWKEGTNSIYILPALPHREVNHRLPYDYCTIRRTVLSSLVLMFFHRLLASQQDSKPLIVNMAFYTAKSHSFQVCEK